MVVLGNLGDKPWFVFRKLCSSWRPKNYLEHSLNTIWDTIWGSVGHWLLARTCDPPGGSWADHARWAMCPDGRLGTLFPKPASRILNRDPTLARPCIADNGHRMDFALPRQAMEPPWALIDGPS